MSNVIRFLESLGSDAGRCLSPSDYAATVALLDIDEAQQQALLDRDPAQIGELLGGRPAVLFAIFAPDEDEKEEEPDSEVPESEVRQKSNF